MKSKFSVFLLITIALALILATTAQAKRFGGGYSFGSKKSYSSPFQKKSTQKSFTQQKTAAQQKATATNQQRKQQLASRGGLMGILGGLALGGLLGALFFGGAFEGFNFFDFLIIGGIILGFIWFMKRKSPAPQVQPAGTGGGDFNIKPSDIRTDAEASRTSQFKLASDQQDADFTDGVSGSNESSSKQAKKEASFAESFGMNFGHADTQASADSFDHEITLPGWFDQQEFLSGARSAYTLLQQAWDSGELDTIRGLTTDSVYNEIARQFTNQAPQGTTRISQLNAELVDFQQLDQQAEAAVMFDALLSESDDLGNQGRTKQVKELWHFIRDINSAEPTWYLDGIQQMD